MKIVLLLFALLPLLLVVGVVNGSEAGVPKPEPSSTAPPGEPPRDLPEELPAIRCDIVPEREQGAVTSLVFTPDGATLLAGNQSGVVQWFDPETGQKKLTSRVKRPFRGSGGLALTADGQRLVTQSGQNEVTMFDAITERPLLAFEKIHPTQEVSLRGIAVAPGDDLVAGGFTSGEVAIWDVATGHLRTILPPDDGPPAGSSVAPTIRAISPSSIRSLVFTPDGKSLIALGGTVRTWDLAANAELARLEVKKSTNWRRMALSPDGKMLGLLECRYATNPDHTFCDIVLRDRATQREVARWPLGDSGVALAFAPDGKTIVSLESEATVRLWDVATGKSLDAVRYDRHTHLSSLVIAPNGRRIALAGWEDDHIFGVIDLLETDGTSLQPWKPTP